MNIPVRTTLEVKATPRMVWLVPGVDYPPEDEIRVEIQPGMVLSGGPARGRFTVGTIEHLMDVYTRIPFEVTE